MEPIPESELTAHARHASGGKVGMTLHGMNRLGSGAGIIATGNSRLAITGEGKAGGVQKNAVRSYRTDEARSSAGAFAEFLLSLATCKILLHRNTGEDIHNLG